MGQEHSSVSLYNSNQREFEKAKYRQKENSEFLCQGYKKPLRQKKSSESFKSDLSSTESSGYRSESNSGYQSASEKSSNDSDYSRTSIYRNSQYKDRSRDLYKPVKITKDKLYKLQYLDPDKDTCEYLEKHLSIKSYLNELDKVTNGKQVMKEASTKGIRNYTPKILSEEEKGKKFDDWI